MTVLDPIAPEVPARVVIPARARLRVRPGRPSMLVRPLTPVVYPAGHCDILRIVETHNGADLTGKPLAEVRGVSIDKPTSVLNGVGSMGFSCSTWNDAMDHFVIPGTEVDGAGVMRLVGREVEFWRDGVLRWKGPPISAQWGLDGTITFSCMDLGWWIARKYFGAAERTDRLAGAGSMDTLGLPGWTTIGATKTRDTIDRARGVSSMKLSGNGTAQATVLRPIVAGVSRELAAHVTGVVKIPAGTPVGTAVLTITIRDLDGTIRDEATAVTTEDTILGAWVQVSTYALIPPYVAHNITTTLWSPGDHGDTGFDDVKVLENQKTARPAPGVDLTMAGMLAIDHIQRGYGQGKGFGFTYTMLSESGVVEPFSELHGDHKQLPDFFSQYTSRADGWDWRIDPALRQVQFAKRLGVDHTNFQINGRTVSAGGVTHDEAEISAKIVVPGDGDGVDRPEGGYTDTSRTAGLTLDYFHQPPAGTELSALDPMARQVWEEKSQPQLSFNALAISDRYLGIVNEGDRVSGTLRSGKFRLPYDTKVRLSSVALDVEAGQLVLT